MKAFFKNPEGYRIVKDVERSSWWKAVYHFSLDISAPLSFVDEDGVEYKPRDSYLTDWGTIPRFPSFIRFFVPPDRFLAFLLHDCGYSFGGLLVGGVWVTLTRRKLDALMYNGILVDPDPGNKLTAWAVWLNVRVYGWAGWDSYRKGERSQLKLQNRNKKGGGKLKNVIMSVMLAGLCSMFSGCASVYTVANHDREVMAKNALKLQATPSGAMLGVDVLSIGTGYIQAWADNPGQMVTSTIFDGLTGYGLYLAGKELTEESEDSGPGVPQSMTVSGNGNNIIFGPGTGNTSADYISAP